MKLHRILTTSIGSLACGVLVGCSATTKSGKFVTPFVAPAPRLPQSTYAIQEPPKVEPSFYQRESPRLLAQAVQRASEAPEIDYLSRQAETHYSKGSVLMGKGESAAARAEFDKAIETISAAPASLPGRERLAAKYQKMVEDIYRMEVEVAAQSGPTPEPVFDKVPLEEAVDLTFPVEPALKGKVRHQLRATVSQLPLKMADPVLSFINFFQSPRGRDILVSGFYRAGRYAPMIRRILDEEGVPQELIYLAQAESGFLPRAVSYMSATGMWQFIKDRGREYGLNQSQFTDDRLDPEKATRAAARHLRDLYEEFGDWYLAIAAYNCGPLAVDRAVQRTGYADFWELYKRNVLPKETANYVPIILAMTIMAKNPKDYGLENVSADKAMAYDSIKVSANTHLALVADIVNRPLSEIRELNPAVLRMVAPDGYTVHVPKGSGKQVLSALESVPSLRRASWRMHRVNTQETVASIAKQYKITEKSISEANSNTTSEPQAGDLLVIPVGYPGPEAVFTTASYTRYAPARRTTTIRRSTPAPAVKSRTYRKPAATTARPASKAPVSTGARKPAAPAARAATQVRKLAPAPAVKRRPAPANRAGTAPKMAPRHRASLPASGSGKPTLVAVALQR